MGTTKVLIYLDHLSLGDGWSGQVVGTAWFLGRPEWVMMTMSSRLLEEKCAIIQEMMKCNGVLNGLMITINF